MAPAERTDKQEGGKTMGKKHVNDDKPAGYGGKSVSGDRSGRSKGAGGERNVGKKSSEEHSRVPKGRRGGEKKR